LEAVSDFELAKPAVVLVPVIELAVGEIRHASLRASLYGTGQQSICNSLVMVGSFGSQLQDRGDISAPDQPQKSDEFVVIVPESGVENGHFHPCSGVSLPILVRI
jgi:hypothetical protein